MITASLTLNKDQLDIVMLSVRDSLNWYRFSSTDSDHSKELQAHYALKARECIAVEEIISDARRELVRQEMKRTRK